MIQPPADTPAPDAYFDCVGCQGEVTYPADMLRWWDGFIDLEDADLPSPHKVAEPGWWCEHCHRGDCHREELEGHLGPTLAEWLLAIRLDAPVTAR